jgi:hypothetical protein
VAFDDMIVVPAPGVGEAETMLDRNPWAELAVGVGMMSRERAWLATVRKSMFEIESLVRATPRKSAALPAAWFFVRTATLACLLFVLVAWSALAAEVMFYYSIFFTPSILSVFIVLVPLYVFPLMGVVVWIIGIHFIARCVAPTTGGVARTMTSVSYACGGLLLCAAGPVMPFVVPIGFAWWALNAGMAVREAHGVRGAPASVLLIGFPIVVSVGSGVAGLVVFLRAWAW